MEFIILYVLVRDQFIKKVIVNLLLIFEEKVEIYDICFILTYLIADGYGKTSSCLVLL